MELMCVFVFVCWNEAHHHSGISLKRVNHFDSDSYSVTVLNTFFLLN